LTNFGLGADSEGPKSKRRRNEMDDLFEDDFMVYPPPFREDQETHMRGPTAANLIEQYCPENAIRQDLSMGEFDPIWGALQDPRTKLAEAYRLIEILGKQWHFRAESMLFACYLLFPDPISRWALVMIGNYYTYSSLIHFKQLCEKALLQFYSTHPLRRERARELLKEIDSRLKKPTFYKFEIGVSAPRTEGRYQMRVLNSPWPGCTGVGGRGEILVFSRAHLETLGQFNYERQQRSIKTEELEPVGSILLGALMAGKVGKCLENSLILSQKDPQGMGMSLVLHLYEGAEGLSGLPWNALFDAQKKRFLVREGDLTVTFQIYPKNAMPLNPWRGERDVRLLVIRSEPDKEIRRKLAEEGISLRQLDTKEETENFNNGLENWNRDSDSVLRLDQVEALDDDIFREMSTHRYDYDGVHYFGHGLHDGSQGYLIFQEERGGSGPLRSGRDLLTLIGKNSNLQVVTLMACQSGVRSIHGDGNYSLAEAFTREGIPSVIAMQQPIRKTTALTFSRHFYHEMMRTQSIERGFKLAIGAISCRLDKKDAPEWSAPVMFTRRAGQERSE